MSEKTIEFFWDVGSPYTYLASTQIDRIAENCNITAQWRPFLLGGVFRETGNRPPIEVAAKGAYMLQDLQAWADCYQVPFSFASDFPVNSLVPMRAAVGADRLGKGREFGAAIMRLYWAEGKNPSDPEVIKMVSLSIGLDDKKLSQMVQEGEIKDALKENTAEAVRRGAFGAPTFFVGDKMFWGNDRLVLLENFLKGS